MTANLTFAACGSAAEYVPTIDGGKGYPQTAELVSMESGAIKRGDPITSSSKAGYGMKARGACKVIGYALEDANTEGTIQVFADLGDNSAAQVAKLQQENDALKQQVMTFEARLAALELTATPHTAVAAMVR